MLNCESFSRLTTCCRPVFILWLDMQRNLNNSTSLQNSTHRSSHSDNNQRLGFSTPVNNLCLSNACTIV